MQRFCKPQSLVRFRVGAPLTELSTTELKGLQELLQGVQATVEAPMAFERGDPDKKRIREIQALVAFILQSELAAGNAVRLLQLVDQLRLLFEDITGVGFRVSMKPAMRMVERSIALLRGVARDAS